LLYRDITGLWLVLDRAGEIVRALVVTGFIDAVATARDWLSDADNHGSDVADN
jgi:hypothetical protein